MIEAKRKEYLRVYWIFKKGVNDGKKKEERDKGGIKQLKQEKNEVIEETKVKKKRWKWNEKKKTKTRHLEEEEKKRRNGIMLITIWKVSIKLFDLSWKKKLNKTKYFS